MKPGVSLPVYLSEEALDERVQALAQEIRRDTQGKPLVAVGVLKGCFIFFADLVRHLENSVVCEFFALANYGSSRLESGKKKILLDIQESLAGKHLLLILDLVDTGQEMAFLHRTLSARNPASLKTCALLVRRATSQRQAAPDYVGFEIGQEFLAGYGIDSHGKYRQLPYVGVLAGGPGVR